MKFDKLVDLYHSHKADCSICGITLEAEGSLGDFFVLDTSGRFYCAECDSEFLDGDERIFEPDLYLAEAVSNYTSKQRGTQKAQQHRADAYHVATRKWGSLPKRNESVRAGIMRKSTLGKIHNTSDRHPPKEYKHRRTDDSTTSKLAEFNEED